QTGLGAAVLRQNSLAHETPYFRRAKLRRLSSQFLLRCAGRIAGDFHPDGALPSRAAVSRATRSARTPGKRPLWRGVFRCHQRLPHLHAVSARGTENQKDRSLEILRPTRTPVAAALLRRVVPASGPRRLSVESR